MAETDDELELVAPEEDSSSVVKSAQQDYRQIHSHGAEARRSPIVDLQERKWLVKSPQRKNNCAFQYDSEELELHEPSGTESDEKMVIDDSTASGDVSLGEERFIDSVEDAFGDMNYAVDSSGPLTVVIDAANVGWNHGGTHWSPRGVTVLIEHIRQEFSNGCDNGSRVLSIQAFLPASYIRRRPTQAGGNVVMQTEDWEVLDELVGLGLLSLVPAGDSDDAYIISHAKVHNGFIVSNDHYTDHMSGIHSTVVRSSYEEWLKSRRCGFTFPRPDEVILNPSRLSMISVLANA
jgi:hypothetical protein